MLYLGRINWKKGLDRLISAMVDIEGCRALIVGNDEENYLPELKRQVLTLGLDSRITFLPRFVSGADKEFLYRNAKLFVLPSYSENFGNTVVEAMASGCPVLTTREVGAAELLVKSDGGVVCDGHALGVEMRRLISDPNGLERYGKSAKDWVEKNLEWNSVAATVLDEYRSIVNTARA